MKTYASLCIAILVMISFTNCDEDTTANPETNSIVGTWQLTAQYIDNGGGGVFEPIVNGKSITVHADGTWNCNVSICLNSLTQATTSGSYTTDQFIAPDCTVTYTLADDVMDLQHPQCIEPCIDRYTRVD